MTDLSRRAILSRAGLVGAAGLGTGMGTYAMVTDTEGGWLAATSGTLDLQLASSTGGGVPTDFQPESNVTVAFPSFPPGAQTGGTMTVAMRSCSNQAVGRLTVPAVPDVALAEHIDVVLSYDPDCGTDSNSTVIYEGTIVGLDDTFGNGIPLGVDCAELGKLEYDDETGMLSRPGGDSVHVDDLPHPYEFGSVTITVTAVNAPDGKVIGLDVETDGTGLCRVEVKGGGRPGEGEELYSLDCATAASGLNAGLTPSGTQSGLSHAEFYVCEGERQCISCETPSCLTLDWSYEPPKRPADVESLANQELDFDLEFSATQCRHTANTTQ